MTDSNTQVFETRVIGLTGGICAGKSTVANILKEKFHAVVIDADKLGHEAYEPGTDCMNALVSHFGSAIVTADGQIDRRALGGIVFADKSKMAELQNIVWPCIRQKIISNIRELSSQQLPLVVVEAAVMIEAGWQDLVQQLWVVRVEPEIAIERLMKRNSFTEEEARKRLNSQLSNAERCQHAHLIIDNTGNAEELEALIQTAFA